jgi:hypoxanthine phosphoribosyltransferase
MMDQVRIHDKNFRLFIDNEKIIAAVDKMAKSMNKDLVDKNPLFVCILNGSFIFAAELFRRIEILNSEITFVRLASYNADRSTGDIKELLGLNENIEGRCVVVLEDIVDSGLTIDFIITQLKILNPAEILVATLLLKPDALKKDVKLNYVGLEIPDDFIVGYGLDYDGYGRNLKDIYSIINE